MKGLLRSPFVQRCLARIIAVYIELIIKTLRWRILGREPVDLAMTGRTGAIGVFWHGRIVQAMACRPLLRDKPRKVMISLSRDGEFIARAAQLLGIPAIRGSTGKDRRARTKGGLAAFRQASAMIDSGGVIILTPDGPRGPAETFGPGPVRLASATQCPVFLMGLAASPAIRLKTWDQMRIPLPFARAMVVLRGPLAAPKIVDAAQAEAVGNEWGAELRSAQKLAESMI